MKGQMESPTGLDMYPRPPAAVRVRKSIGVVLLIILALLAMAIVYGVYERQHRQFQVSVISNDERKARPATTAGKEVTANLISADAPEQKQEGIPVQNPNSLQAAGASPLGSTRPGVSAPRPPSPLVSPSLASPAPTLEYNERARLHQKEEEAIESPIGIGGTGRASISNANPNPTYQTGVPLSGASAPVVLNPAGGGIPVPALTNGDYRSLGGMSQAAEYNAQNGQDEKSSFIARARSRAPDNYLASIRTAPLSKCEVKAGWNIPAILEQGINSDQPGEIRALVRETVFDTATGMCVVIPQGSRLIGRYNSVVTYGQDGLQAVWERLIFPDGSSLDLNGMIGQDARGESGLRYAVDNHYARLAGFAVLTSLFSAGFQLSQNRPGTILATPSAGEVVAGAVGSEISQVGVEITRRNLNVQPTIKIPAGYRFNVRVNRDIVFDTAYVPR